MAQHELFELTVDDYERLAKALGPGHATLVGLAELGFQPRPLATADLQRGPSF